MEQMLRKSDKKEKEIAAQDKREKNTWADERGWYVTTGYGWDQDR